MRTDGNFNTRFLRLRDVLAILPISRTSFYDGIKLGLYPQPIKLGKRTSVWCEHEIHESIDRMN